MNAKPCLSAQDDGRRLGRHLLWHVLGAKTIALLHENVHVGAIRDHLDELVLDAE